MILQLKKEVSLGVFQYKPLDMFDDFEIKYNHQYEDYTDIGGKRIPYTNKFKIPLSDNNRDLCGVSFDLSYPVSHSVDGRVLYADGNVAFNFVADIERQVINVLEPYIEITIVDLISKAIGELSKWKMSDLMSSNDTTRYVSLQNDNHVYGVDYDTDINEDHLFIFPFYNFNNKNAIFGIDPMRKISQLQPTFVLNRLVKKIFQYVGLTIESDFLNLDNQLATGIKANQLGLMLPCQLKTSDNYSFTADNFFTGNQAANNSVSVTERVGGVPTYMPTTSKIGMTNFVTSNVDTDPYKFNFDHLDDGTFPFITQASWCSLVEGKVRIQLDSKNPAVKPIVRMGKLLTETNDFMIPINTIGTWGDLDVKIVICDEMKVEPEGSQLPSPITWESGITYDAKTAQRVGNARFLNNTATTNRFEFEIEIDPTTEIEFDVEPNKIIKLAYILTPKEGVPFVHTYTGLDVFTNSDLSYESVMELEILDGYIKYTLVTSNGGVGNNDYYTKQEMEFTRPSAASFYQTRMTVFIDEPTDMPTGIDRGAFSPGIPDEYIFNSARVDMYESMKSVKDYTLIDVVRMIVERYNLQMYSKGDGNIYLDTKDNRTSNNIQVIDHLIDEGVDIEFTSNDNGIINIKDDNPSFYDDNYNLLDAFVVSETKRDTVSLNLRSSIVNSKMFEDVYDESAFDLLRIKPDSNYWGVSDRKIEEPSSFKPSFCLLESSETPLYLPVNKCSITQYDEASEDPQLDAGFYNTFHSTGKRLLLQAKNEHSTGFSLLSFKDGVEIINNENLYRKTWFSYVMDKINDESVIVSFDLYVSESVLKTLLTFPKVYYKGQEWGYEGLNDYPLSAQNGGLTKVTLIKKKIWS